MEVPVPVLYIIVPNERFAPFGAEFLKKSRPTYMGVSLNGGTQQLLVFLLKIIIWMSFGGTTILGNTHIPISMMTSERTGSEIGPKFHHTSRGPVHY